MRLLLYSITAFLLLVANIGFCQEVSIERYTQEDGLPSDLIKALAMDSDGFIWVGTDFGIAKIEGGNIIKPIEFNPIDGVYKDLFYSPQGLIAATDLGIVKISQDFRDLHINYFSEALDSLSHRKYAKQIFESKDASIWVTFPNHIIRITDDKIHEYHFPEKNKTYHYFRSFQFFEADDHHYALSQKGYLYLLNRNTNEFTEVPWSLSGTEVYSVLKINEEKFLMGCDEGLLQINFKNGEISEVATLNFKYPVSVITQISKTEFVVGTWEQGAYLLKFNEAGLDYRLYDETENLEIQDILLDKQKQVWIATPKGVFAYRQLAFYQPFKELQNQHIRNFSHGEGPLFFTVDNWVYRLDSNQQLHKHYFLEDGEITALYAYGQALYIGTKQGEIIHKDSNGSSTLYDFAKEGSEVYSIALDKNKNIWFLQQRPEGAALLKIDSTGSMLDFTPQFYNAGYHNLNSLKISPDGDLYVLAGGIDEYLYRYNYETKRIENLSITIEALGGELLWIFDLCFLENDTLLLATHKGVFSLHNQTMVRLDLGLYTDKVALAVTAVHDRFWISSHDGLLCYDQNTVILFNNVDGLPSKYTIPGGLYVDEQNNLWAGTVEGLAVSKIPGSMPQSSMPVISTVKKSGIVIDGIEKNKFLQNSLLRFTFASPDYPAKHVQYQYALMKNNEAIQWIDLAKKTDFLYLESLTKGNYILMVRARNKGHFVWSEPTTYQFKVYKIWYTRPEYIVGINLIILVLGYLFLQYRQTENKRKREELENVIAVRTKELVEKNEKLVKTQNQLIQSEKMASVGILAAGVAHEINNPINYVSGGIAVLKKTIQKLETHLNNFSLAYSNCDQITKETYNLPDENAIANITKVTDSMFGTIEEGIKKTTDIVQSIRIFSSSSENVFVQMDINEALDSILLMLYNKYKGRIDIVKDYDANTKIIAAPANIQQVFMNLLVNAIQAIPQKGIIWIKTQRKHSTIKISIKDTGKGIPKVIQKKIYDPFFSTKDVGKGTGLGLYLSYTFVQQHHGTIKVFSESGKGAEFVVELPLIQQQANE